MQPNTPHFVFGLENTICYGSHHYSTMTMQLTLQGVVHTFILDKFITNTSHFATRSLLRRIVIFYLDGTMGRKIPIDGMNTITCAVALFHAHTDPTWPHLPDLEQFDGLMNLLSACVLGILGNVLDFRTYNPPSGVNNSPLTESEKLLLKHDVNAMPLDDRMASCYARGAAFHLFEWVRSCCLIYGPDGTVVDDLPSQFLVQIGKAMLRYKRKALAKKLDGVTHCSLSSLNAQLTNVMQFHEKVWQIWQLQSEPSESLELADKSKYSLKWKDGWQTNAAWRTDDASQFLSLYADIRYLTSFFQLFSCPFSSRLYSSWMDRLRCHIL